jgi:PAS domain S-box-containing protein
VTPATAGITARGERLSAYLEAALDCVVMADASGRVVEFNPAAERIFGYTRDEALGRLLAELIVPPSLRKRHSRAFAQFAKTRKQTLFGQKLELTGMRADGSEFPVELALSQVEGEPLLICGALRDLTDAKQAEDDLRELADEQAALRRVATLVAQGSEPAEVFGAVAEGVARILKVPAISMIRFELDGTATKIAGWGESPFSVGTRWTLDDPSVMASVMQDGRPARIDDYASLGGEHARRVSDAGIGSAIGAPIVVDGKSWGVVVAFSTDAVPLSADGEGRLARFTELVGTAISNTQAREDLRGLADKQAALRRVATLVAQRATSAEIFATVAEEVAQVLEIPLIEVSRYETNGTYTVVGAWGDHPFVVGSNWPVDEDPLSVEMLNTGRSARIENLAELPGSMADALREAEVGSAVGVPIIVAGEVWGLIAVGWRDRKPLPDDLETRLTDFTELVATAISDAQARDDLRRLADEQAALRQVATLVARGADPHAVFDAVCEETGRLLGATSTNLAHFSADGFNVTIAGWSLRDTHVPTGTRLPLAGDTINAEVLRTGAPSRFDSYQGASGELAAVIRERGIRSEVGAPVLVEGRVWGALVAGWDTPEPPPQGSEFRLASFAELVATAVSNATTRNELVASRTRIVTAADEARRRIERNLHDGTQQRLVTISLELQAAKGEVPVEARQARTRLESARRAIDAVQEEVREISRGLHPALLSQAGLGPALTSLARRSSVPVELDVALPVRPSESVEIAVYYAVSEALANAAKYANASVIHVDLVDVDDAVRLTVHDDGVGGADASRGSGLIGLVDRVEALGGRFALESLVGSGTRISIELPMAPGAAAS